MIINRSSSFTLREREREGGREGEDRDRKVKEEERGGNFNLHQFH